MSKLIYIADDDKDILDLIEVFLVNAGYKVGIFNNADSLYFAFEEQPSDMVILDITMPGTDGLTMCSRLRLASNVPIIIVSAKGSELDRVMGITLGSDDYLVKPFSPMELVARVNSIFRLVERSKAVDFHENTLCYGDICLSLGKRTAQVGAKELDLTPTEFDFLAYLINRPEKAVSREELLKNVWQMEYEIGVRVTDDVVKRLRKKLTSLGSSTELATVWGYGFKIIKGAVSND